VIRQDTGPDTLAFERTRSSLPTTMIDDIRPIYYSSGCVLVLVVVIITNVQKEKKRTPVADLHRSKISSAWGPRIQGAPNF